MSRWKAAGIHLSLSVFIGLVCGALMFGLWYPPPYFKAAGADELVLLLVGVDAMLGPLLTLIIFKAGKRGLKFDLALIAIVQSVALIYGLSIVLRSRPVFLVAAVDRFSLVSASDIDDQDLADAKPEYRSLSWTGPRIVGANVPRDGSDRLASAISAFAGKDIDRIPKYYVDYAETADGILARAKPLTALKLKDDRERETIAEAVRKTGQPPESIVWVPLAARKANLVMLLDGKSGTPLHAADVNPWVH
jgi:hypothetical protein